MPVSQPWSALKKSIDENSTKPVYLKMRNNTMCIFCGLYSKYQKFSNVCRTKTHNLNCFSSRLAVVSAKSIEARCQVENEVVVGKRRQAIRQLYLSDQKIYCLLMPQSHHTPGPRTGCSRAVLNKNRTSTHRPRAAPYEFCLPVRGP